LWARRALRAGSTRRSLYPDTEENGSPALGWQGGRAALDEANAVLHPGPVVYRRYGYRPDAVATGVALVLQEQLVADFRVEQEQPFVGTSLVRLGYVNKRGARAIGAVGTDLALRRRRGRRRVIEVVPRRCGLAAGTGRPLDTDVPLRPRYSLRAGRALATRRAGTSLRPYGPDYARGPLRASGTHYPLNTRRPWGTGHAYCPCYPRRANWPLWPHRPYRARTTNVTARPDRANIPLNALRTGRALLPYTYRALRSYATLSPGRPLGANGTGITLRPW
jgi:hypothetical protein